MYLRIVLICAILNFRHQFAKVYSANDVFLAISPKFAPSKVSLHTVCKDLTFPLFSVAMHVMAGLNEIDIFHITL